VTAVEIREILPPKEIKDAMTRQMSAERTRRMEFTHLLKAFISYASESIAEPVQETK
jgi:regulator of protease activity HflC (stomatin/prohibitin superfamily)